ncbi:MAG: hypothetical protein V7637_2938 [Mycobacteriales bacterium]
MTRQWDSDDALLAELHGATHRPGPPADAIRRAGHAAFRFRTAGTGRVIAGLTYDSALDGAGAVRGDEPGGRRALTFTAAEMSVEVELADGRVIGQLIPPVAAEVQLLTVTGSAGESTADSLGCFVLPRPGSGPARFKCVVGDQVVYTDWVSI